MNESNSTASAQLLEQTQKTGEAIFKSPETFSDLIVTGTAVIAIAIVVSYAFKFVLKVFNASSKPEDN